VSGTTLASAPGKLVILGEYAVLAGAPALVMAVNRRAAVSLSAARGRRWRIAAPHWTRREAVLEFSSAGQPAWRDHEDNAFSLPRGVIDALAASGAPLAACPPLTISLDSSALSRPGSSPPVKLGLGSSAALTVALAAGLGHHARCHVEPGGRREPPLQQLIEIHAALQGSRGSGLDVAASLYGGVIVYRRDPAPQAEPARLPRGVQWCCVWTGTGAATGPLLATLETWRTRRGNEYGTRMDSLTDVAAAGVKAAQAGDTGAFLDSIHSYGQALQALGEAAGTDIVSGPHRRLESIARQSGIVYKVCGAGGGDAGIGMSRDGDAIADFARRARAAGFHLLSLDRDDEGVTITRGS